MIGNLKIVIISILFCLTIPGIANAYAIYLGSFTVKFFSLGFLFLSLPQLINLRGNSLIKSILITLILLFLYRFFHSSPGAQEQLLPLISIVWFILIVLSIRGLESLKIFLFFFYLATILVVLSPGVERIFDFSRIGFTEARSDNALTGIANHYIEYAQVCLFCLFLSFYFFRTVKSKVFKILNLLLFFTALLAVITAGSRGAIISLVIIFLLYFRLNYKYIMGKKLNRKKMVWVLICFLFFSYFLPWSSLLDSFSVLGTSKDISSLRRIELIYYSLDLFTDNPFFGNGWDSIRSIKGLPSHSLLLQVLAELGLIGLVAEFLIYYMIYRIFLGSINIEINSIQQKNLLVLGLFCIQISLGIWSLFENIGFVFGTRLIYANAAILVAVNFLINQENISK